MVIRILQHDENGDAVSMLIDAESPEEKKILRGIIEFAFHEVSCHCHTKLKAFDASNKKTEAQEV